MNFSHLATLAADLTRAEDLADFISLAPSSYHAAQLTVDLLQQHGFTQVTQTENWPTAPGGYVLKEGGAVAAWIIPDQFDPAQAKFKIAGSHTDSPGFKLKPNPAYQKDGFQQASVEVYGGPLLHSWFDRDVLFAGEVLTASGETKLVKTDPIARIASLAIHLYREDSFSPDRQKHLQPVVGLDSSQDVLAAVAAAAGVSPAEVVNMDVITVDSQRPQAIGTEQDLFAAGRLDNLSSVYASLVSLLTAQKAATQQANTIAVLIAYDNEEIGSQTTTGAGGPLLENLLTRILLGQGADFLQVKQAFSRSHLISADAAHAIHPNYPEKHDPQTFPVLGKGVAVKVNANQRYATDPASFGPWFAAAQAAGVTYQQFVGNNAVPCGSTIGPISATRLGIETIDVGIPLLSMHSARELCALQDLEGLARVIASYWAIG